MSGFALRDAAGFDSWMMAVSERLRRVAGAAFDRLAAAHAAAGDYPRAIATSERRLELDPLHERAHRHLMLLHAWSGDRAGAVEAYRRAVAILDTELGVPPLEETTDLYEAILSEDLPRAPAVARTPPTESRPVAQPPLVGRALELGRVQAVLDTGVGVVLVEGPAGSGRTRLLAEVAATAAATGRTILSARAHRAESAVPYSVVHTAVSEALADEAARTRIDRLPAAVLAEAARLFPALSPVGTASRHAAAKTRFLDALMEVIGALDRPVLIIDDLDLVDQASAEFIGFLARRAADAGVVLIVAAAPPSPLATNGIIANLISDLREMGERVVLGPLGVAEVAVLIRSAGVDTSAEAVLAETGGSPLLVTEHLDRLRSGSDRVPDAVRRHVLGRVATVGEAAGQVLTAAAVLGEEFDADLIAEVSGRSAEETDLALDELVRAGLLDERGDGRMSLVHKNLVEVVISQATRARRRSLHRRAATAMTTRGIDAGTLASVAYHHAGAGNDGEAAIAYRRAGEAAAAVFAHRDAVAHYESAIAFGHDDRTGLQARIGDLWTLEGEYGHAISAYGAALASIDQVLAPDLEHRLGSVHLRLRRWDLAAAHFERALADTDGPPAFRAIAAADAAYAQHRMERAEKAAELMQSALDDATRSGDARALAKAHNVAGLLADTPDQRLRHLDLALGEAPDTPARVAVLNNLAVTAIEAGDAPTAVTRTRQALELAMDLGDRHLMAALHNNLADALHLAAESDEAMTALTEAVRLFVDVRSGTGTWEPDVWLLTEW